MNQSQKIAIITAASAAIAILFQSSPAVAQSYGSGAADLSVANGNVVIVRGDSGSQVAATVNAPIVSGDYVSTGPGALAEVQFDGASMLRLASNSQVRFVNLSPGSREAQLGAGTVDLAQLQGNDGGTQIDTPSVAVRPNTNGDYRVSVSGNGQTVVTVRSGSATVSSGQGSQTLTPGSTLVAYGPYSNPSISQQGAIGFDSFDQFNMSRDQSLASAYNANPYLSPQLAGYSNLSNYGQWQDVPGYGWAWAPNNQNQSNFAPYQNGQWAWEPGYGYTWVDNAPYGYTVSHYGSWFNNSNYGGWLWQPPASQYQSSPSALGSAWLPAAVSFFLTGGSGFDLNSLLNGFSSLSGAYGNNANIGWIPLAPGEQYQPWYGSNYSYPATQLTNVPNVTNIYNYYGNARYYRGITMVPVSGWRSGGVRYVSVRPQELKRVYLVRGSVPIVPTTENLHYTTTRVSRPVAIAHTFTTARFVSKAPATHVSFAQQQARIKEIAVAKPKVVPLPEHRVATHPVYRPEKRTEVHVTAMKPVTHEAAPAKHQAAPAKHEAAPAKHEAAPAKHEAAPAKHEAAPAPKHESHPASAPKAQTHPAPASKPVEHPKPATQPEHAVTHHEPTSSMHKPPVNKPETHPVATPKPVVHEVHPAKPVAHEAPVEKPVVHEPAAAKPPVAPHEKPVTHEPAPQAPKSESKHPEEKPAAKPTARPVL